MFGSKFIVAAVLSVSVVLQVQGHAIFVTSAALATAAVRADVTTAGTCDAAAALKTPATASADGTFTIFAKNFNGGTDGSTAVKTATLDTTGQGKTFSGTVTVIKNGVASPASTETDQLTLQLPAGTTCTGTGGTCLVALASDGGFGDCVGVKVAGKTTRRHARDFLSEEESE